ncbi:hypothetical protein BJ742DRAFT_852630 [Cladochytrium replicatum]|nr:hypothetical protein BJ742DRAFT_852630 [Cladochytrium replicatum]
MQLDTIIPPQVLLPASLQQMQELSAPPPRASSPTALTKSLLSWITSSTNTTHPFYPNNKSRIPIDSMSEEAAMSANTLVATAGVAMAAASISRKDTILSSYGPYIVTAAACAVGFYAIASTAAHVAALAASSESLTPFTHNPKRRKRRQAKPGVDRSAHLTDSPAPSINDLLSPSLSAIVSDSTHSPTVSFFHSEPTIHSPIPRYFRSSIADSPEDSAFRLPEPVPNTFGFVTDHYAEVLTVHRVDSSPEPTSPLDSANSSDTQRALLAHYKSKSHRLSKHLRILQRHSTAQSAMIASLHREIQAEREARSIVEKACKDRVKNVEVLLQLREDEWAEERSRLLENEMRYFGMATPAQSESTRSARECETKEDAPVEEEDEEDEDDIVVFKEDSPDQPPAVTAPQTARQYLERWCVGTLSQLEEDLEERSAWHDYITIAHHMREAIVSNAQPETLMLTLKDLGGEVAADEGLMLGIVLLCVLRVVQDRSGLSRDDLRKTMRRYRMVVWGYMKNEGDQERLIELVERAVAAETNCVTENPPKDMNRVSLKDAFLEIVMALYDADLVDTGAVLKWYRAKLKQDGPDELTAKTKIFVDWLEKQDDEDSDDDCGSEIAGDDDDASSEDEDTLHDHPVSVPEASCNVPLALPQSHAVDAALQEGTHSAAAKPKLADEAGEKDGSVDGTPLGEKKRVWFSEEKQEWGGGEEEEEEEEGDDGGK